MEERKKEPIDFIFLIEDFIESFQFYHSKEETEELICSMLKGERVPILPSYLDVLDSKQLEEKLSYMIIEKFKNSPNERETLQKYVELIEERKNLKIQKQKNQELKWKRRNLKLKRITTIGIITAICIAGAKPNNEKETSSNSKEISTKETKLEFFQDPDFFKEYFIEQGKLQKVEYERQEEARIQKEQEEAEKKRKKKILSHYSKCKSIQDIKKRQKELESIDWKKSDKIYPKCKLSAPLQRFIYEQSVLYELPPDFTFSIIYAETRGGFNSGGTESYNKSSDSYDLGLTQQNSNYSLPLFQQKYHISSYKKAYKLLKDNDYINVCYAFSKYNGIAALFESYDPYEFAGCYNGWLDWRENDISKAYVKEFKKAYDHIFTKHHKIEKRKTKKVKIKVK